MPFPNCPDQGLQFWTCIALPQAGAFDRYHICAPNRYILSDELGSGGQAGVAKLGQRRWV